MEILSFLQRGVFWLIILFLPEAKIQIKIFLFLNKVYTYNKSNNKNRTEKFNLISAPQQICHQRVVFT
jgi:hypothetical protein